MKKLDASEQELLNAYQKGELKSTCPSKAKLAKFKAAASTTFLNEKRGILMPSVKDNANIVAAANADPDAKPMTKAQLDALVPIRAVRGRRRSGRE